MHSLSPQSTHRLPEHTKLRASTSAFTLLEVILAVTIAGALLAAAATLMVSVTDVWMERQDRHFFEDHVDGVAEFLQASLSSAGTEIAINNESNESGDNSSTTENGNRDEQVQNTTPEVTTPNNQDERNGDEQDEDTESTADTGGGLISVAEDPIDWAQPPGFAEYQDPLLHFRLKDAPPLLVQTDNAPIVGIEVYLYFKDNEGLSLLWYTPLQEDSEDISDLRRTPLSDLITKVEYVYWDESFEKWETETEPQEGDGEEQFILPRFLKLTFDYEGETKERSITIPVPSRSVLLF
ncbi:MAG: hypothetical protein CML13_18155 [Puniceicoccaceae bacterium]|nr:hypothetical protein [Puniceicoccaceae bacterium]|tara:strand:+ start:28622 stop:29506 length:885 start_codon:yes stop_codon:yes gene_type:complete